MSVNVVPISGGRVRECDSCDKVLGKEVEERTHRTALRSTKVYEQHSGVVDGSEFSGI